MLNEKRVKHMVKLALYETKNKKEKLETGSFCKKDYVIFHILRSIVWMTIGYGALVALLGITVMTFWLDKMSTMEIAIGISFVVVAYIGLLITYIVATKKFYGKKHIQACRDEKKFKGDLTELMLLHEKEDIDGEII